MTIEQIVGQNIKEIRLKKGWVQEDLAITSKITRSYIGQIERAERVVSLGTIEKIAKALKVSMAVIVTKDAYKDFQPTKEKY